MAAAGEGDGFGVAGGFGLFAALFVALLELGQGAEQESEFAGGGDVLAVLGGFGLGLGEQVDLVGEAVGGDGFEDVGAVALEVSEVGVDGGAGAAEPVGDLLAGRVPGSGGDGPP